MDAAGWPVDAADWPVGSSDISLAVDEIHVWRAHLKPQDLELANLQSVLVQDELARAARFKFARHRRRYIVGRGILRLLLSRYLEQEPNQITLEYGEFGKPFLPGRELHFNLAHCQDAAVYAFCSTAEVGVDIEIVRPLDDAAGIASRFFSPAENKAFAAVAEEQRMEAFFACWTRKEAFIKALGEGLSHPLADFEVAFVRDEVPALLSLYGSAQAASEWSLFGLEPVKGALGAVAVHGRSWRLVCRQYA